MASPIPPINWNDDGCLNSEFQEVIDVIKSSDDMIKIKTLVDEFMVKIQQYIEKYFSSECAGKTIRFLLSSGMINDVNMEGIDFVYAQNQYDEYINGMNNYIDKIREADACDSECRNKIDSIIEKDFNFVKNLFTEVKNGECLNPRRSMTRQECFRCVDILLDLCKTRIPSFKTCDYDRSYLYKLRAHTCVCFAYFLFEGVRDELEVIIKSIEEPKGTGNISYGVF